MRFRTLVLVCVALELGLMVAPIGAEYNPPGSLLSDDGIGSEEALRRNLDAARWRWGILRVEPWFGLSDASFVRTQSESGVVRDDFTATVGAGVRGYAKTGQRLIWAAHALPEYTWWRDDETKTQLNGRYGLGLFAYLNRLRLEASVRRNQQQGFFSSEIQELTATRNDIGRVAADFALGKRLDLHASHTRTHSENRQDGASVFSLLDREIEETRAGLRFRSPRGWSFGAALEDSVREFDAGARNLSNTGTAGLFNVGYEGQRFRLRLSLERRSLEPLGDSQFIDTDLTTGFLETQWEVHRSIDLYVYGRRQLGFSVRSENSNFLTERVGARIDFRLRGATLQLAAEAGADDYEPVASQVIARADDVVALATTLELQVRRSLRVRVALTHSDYDSNFDRFDRDVTAWTSFIVLTGLRERFQLGDGQKIW